MIFCQGKEWITVQNLATSMLSISYYFNKLHNCWNCGSWVGERCRCSWVPFCAFHFHIFINWKIKLFAISRRVLIFLCLSSVLVSLPSLFRLLHSLCVCQRQKQWRKTIKERVREKERERQRKRGSNRKIETFVRKSVLWFVGLSLLCSHC